MNIYTSELKKTSTLQEGSGLERRRGQNGWCGELIFKKNFLFLNIFLVTELHVISTLDSKKDFGSVRVRMWRKGNPLAPLVGM